MSDEINYLREQLSGQSELQAQDNESKERLYAPQLREQLAESQAAVIAQTNPSKALRIILEGFKGNMLDQNGDTIHLGYPIMNEEGVANLASMLIPFVNDAVRFGNLSDKEIRSMALSTIDDITKDIGLNWREYGMHQSSRDIVIDACLVLIRITLSRSTEQGEKNWLGRVILESVSGGKPMAKKKEDSWYDKILKL